MTQINEILQREVVTVNIVTTLDLLRAMGGEEGGA